MIHTYPNPETNIFASPLIFRLLQSVMLALGLTAFQSALAMGTESAANPAGNLSDASTPITPSTDVASSVPDDQDDHWMALFQSTYVWQKKPGFSALYSGPNSLSTAPAKSYTFSATAFLGWRPWAGTEIYLNPEAVQGVAFSNLTGLAGVPNGELQKVAGPYLTVYRARFFLRQTFELGGDKQAVDAGFNQFATTVDSRRVVLTVGNFALTDIFDGNVYAHDPRTQFLNWTIMDYGAWDFAADARGFSNGAVAELYYDDWAFRYGRVMMPAQSNSLALNPNIMASYGDNWEIEHAHQINGQPGKLRFLFYRNVAVMATYGAANAYAAANGGAPNLANVRANQAKTGYGISLEQSITSDIGIFGRFSKDDGEGEEYAFAEVDSSLMAGVSIKGTRWNRVDDIIGLAAVDNGISAAHRQFLTEGGLGYFLGDGALSYHSEDTIETYYDMKVCKDFWTTFDYQHIANPGYNADRGPAEFFGVRLHTEF